jgi:tripartite ATP-independent transporter DctM subunit
MIIYALQDENVSVGGLFMAGFIPGILIALAMAAVNWWVCKKRDYRSHRAAPSGARCGQQLQGHPALMLIVLIVVGIRFGIFTPTEASVVAVFYALVCGKWVYRTLEWSALPGIAARSAMLTASVLLVMATSAAFAWVLTVEGIPQYLSELIVSWKLSPVMFLIAVNILLLVFGIFMEPLPGVMILVPILAPIAFSLGIDPDHFAMVVIVNLTLGMITPPVGGLLFVTSVSTGVAHRADARDAAVPAGAFRAVPADLVPAMSTWLPHTLGF